MLTRKTDRLAEALAILLGCALTLAIHGYQFGKSNHTVYLLDAIRHANPQLLAHDWFTTQTLQYHALFGLITRAMMRLRILSTSFLLGYLAVVALLHLAWLRVTKLLGGTVTGYLLSVVLFFISAAGTGLGAYQFLQDSSFLPSNVANIAMLWGFVFWIEDRPRAAGICLGIAGAFHLNHAVVAVFIWLALMLWKPRRLTPAMRDGTLAVLGLCIVNIALAARATAARSASMPLAEFVDIYVRLRHPHHYDPSSWPIALWLSFLWPLPFLFLPAVRRHVKLMPIVVLLLAMLLFALTFAGITYASESAIHLSLYRFSIYPKLFSCIAAAIFIARFFNTRTIAITSTLAAVAMIVICLARGPFFGFYGIPEDNKDYLAACDWIRANMPSDATFLVPPNEQSFRLRAQRAIVVNYKAVPQLSAELGEWRNRMQDVLDMPALRALPRGFDRTLQATGERYESLPADKLFEVALKYGARYILVGHKLEGHDQDRIQMTSDRYFLYDVGEHAHRL